ncbi:MAG: DNA polymerase III subunit delta [Candidatus Neomarinimicrobiota bacterium]
MKVKEALKSISLGSTQSVFLLKGNDHFLQEFFIKKVLKTFFKDSSYTKTLMLPDDMSGKEIIEKLTITDLFEVQKLFIIRDPQRIIGRSSADLFEICKNPNPGHLIFLIIDNWFAKTTFTSKIESFIEPIDTQSPFEKDMIRWATYLINEKNKTADSKVVSYLIDMAGESIVHLNNEINKICLLIEPRKYIEIEDLEQFSGWKRERGLWEFLLAYSSKNFEKSIEIGKLLIQGSNQLTSIIIPLTNFYQEMLFIKMKKNGTFDSYGGYIALPASIKKRIGYLAANFSKKEIIDALKLLHGIDKRKKSQNTDDEIELIQFIGKTIG